MNSTHPSPEASAGPRCKAVLPFGVFRFSAIELVVALGLLFVTSPFIEDMPRGDLIEALVLTHGGQFDVSAKYEIKDGHIITTLGGSPFKVAVYNTGDKYVAARSSEFGFANYEVEAIR